MTREQFNNIPVPEGYFEIVENELIKNNDKYISVTEDLDKYKWDLCNHRAIVNTSRKYWSNFRFIRKLDSPEEKINQLKNKSKEFVNKYIPDPTPEVYEKFEQTFLRHDNFGL